ncbi:hypothetical protein MMC13_004089 [Lambiella insularis]|nr:hypothetical protein [Lambiella insularis]
MAFYLVPPDGKPASISPSLAKVKRGVGTNGANSTNNGIHSPEDGHINGILMPLENPTVIPDSTLREFHFTFLIRHPRSSIPSYYRCTVPPLDEKTGFYNFMPSEAGYDELRRVFDYLRSIGEIGPDVAGQGKDSNGPARSLEPATKVEICVVDADDLLDNPDGIIKAYCKSVGLEYDPEMLVWESEADLQNAKDAFAKWNGFHEDALGSTSLKPRSHTKKVKPKHEEDADWRARFGDKAAKVIRETVDANINDYEYLKQFALRV